MKKWRRQYTVQQSVQQSVHVVQSSSSISC